MALLVGSGLSKAIERTSPTWWELLQRVAEDLAAPLGKGIDDPMTQALDIERVAARLSRRGRGRRDARASDFQNKVATIVNETWPTSSGLDQALQGVRAAGPLRAFAGRIRDRSVPRDS